MVEFAVAIHVSEAENLGGREGLEPTPPLFKKGGLSLSFEIARTY